MTDFTRMLNFLHQIGFPSDQIIPSGKANMTITLGSGKGYSDFVCEFEFDGKTGKFKSHSIFEE